MKKFDKKKIFIVIIVLVLVLLLIILGLFTGKDEEVDLSNYPDGTKLITNRKLKAEKCIDNICVSNLHIYYVNKTGTVEFTLENKKDVKASGYYKLVFDDEELIIIYRFDGKGKYNSKTSFNSRDLSKAKDYKFEKLTKEDEKRIK